LFSRLFLKRVIFRRCINILSLAFLARQNQQYFLNNSSEIFLFFTGVVFVQSDIIFLLIIQLEIISKAFLPFLFVIFKVVECFLYNADGVIVIMIYLWGIIFTFCKSIAYKSVLLLG
jgi:hypothetical protein